MKAFFTLLIYRAILPLLFLIAFPGWVVKMLRRGGFGSALNERIGLYFDPPDFEPCRAIHLHAISVGETIIALKLLREWQNIDPEARFVLATGTATGHQTATAANIPNLRVTYAPLDFPWMIRSYLNRFLPSQIILIEGETWPNLLRIAQKRQIPVSLANARLSPRSARRFNKFASYLRPFFSKLSCVCIQEKEHRSIWQNLGIETENIHLTGSIKFDPQSSAIPEQRPDFREMLESFGKGRPVILAASTFPGEEALIASAIRDAYPNALPVIVPRHAERRQEVSQTLTQAGFHVTMRSVFETPLRTGNAVFVIDTTGELATWTTHADVVIIGKSFLSTGGQNPAEAILANKPLILGSHMENFQPLVRHLHAAEAALIARNSMEISAAIRRALNPVIAQKLTQNASAILSSHHGATQRHLKVLHLQPKTA
jgi:3-deoxy-D-manno-octulosonic-acid transferase